MKRQRRHDNAQVLWLCLGVCLLGVSLATQGQAQGTVGLGRGVGRDELTNQSQPRLALVMGNGAYRNTTTLPNPVNDATDIATSLRILGFEVLLGIDKNKVEMTRLIREFGEKLEEQRGVGLFYYAGHGIQVGGMNYLVPVDADIQAEDETDSGAIKLDLVIGKMSTAKAQTNIVILDACRNNPFARRWRKVRDLSESGGLAAVTAPPGTLIAYATQPGNVASDGPGRNGLYTGELLRQMKTPGLLTIQMLQRVRTEVMRKSGQQQVPWEQSSLTNDFYFARSSDAAAVSPPMASLLPAPSPTPGPTPSTSLTQAERKAQVEQLFNEGKRSALRGDYDQAIAKFTQVLALDPRHHRTLGSRARAYYNKGQYDLAIKDYTQALEIEPESYLFYEQRAEVYQAKGDTAKADADRRAATKLREKEKP